MKKVAIIGLGLMGGSIAKALKLSGKYKIMGFDISEDTIALANSQNLIDTWWDGVSEIDSDVTILALSPTLAKRFINDKISLLKKGSILTDICGVKQDIVDFAEEKAKEYGINFVGGHPMAGRAVNGFENSVDSLFASRSYIFTKTRNTQPEALEVLSQMAYDLGCSDVTVTTPDKHDKLIAFTSQLPHILAGTYIKSPASDEHKGFSAGSYHDVSRVASVDENLWSELFLLNKENLLCEIEIFLKNLTAYKDAISNNDRQGVMEIIKEGRILKERDIKKNGKEKPHKFG